MLKLKNVSKFYYSNGIVTSGFSKVNLELNKGEFVAIMGESGSGKTTLVNLIPRFFDATEGEVRVDGINVKDYVIERIVGIWHFSKVSDSVGVYDTNLTIG